MNYQDPQISGGGRSDAVDTVTTSIPPVVTIPTTPNPNQMLAPDTDPSRASAGADSAQSEAVDSVVVGLDQQIGIDLLGWTAGDPGGGLSMYNSTAPELGSHGPMGDVARSGAPTAAAQGIVSRSVPDVDTPGEGYREGTTGDAPVPPAPPKTSPVPARHGTHTVRERPVGSREGLLNGAARVDWELLDRELRRFLSRLGGRTAAPDGPAVPPAWQLWVAAAMAALLAGLNRNRRRQSSPRAAARAMGRPSARSPIPVGPWPLGPP